MNSINFDRQYDNFLIRTKTCIVQKFQTLENQYTFSAYLINSEK